MPPPKSLLVHGWWMINGAKMSKSTGNFIEPVAFCRQWGTDAFRYFVMREMSVGQDADFSQEQFLVRYNSELANNLGNLVNRTLNMTTRFAGGVLPATEYLRGVARAINLSLGKYCSVYHSLRTDLKLQAEYRIHAAGAEASGDYEIVEMSVPTGELQ